MNKRKEISPMTKYSTENLYIFLKYKILFLITLFVPRKDLVQNGIFDNVFLLFSRQNIQDTGKMLKNKNVFSKKIYNFGVNNFLIGVISFVY